MNRPQDDTNLLRAILSGANPLDITGVQPNSFYDPRDGQIWQAMVELAASRVRPDRDAIAARLGSMADPDHLQHLTSEGTSPHNAQWYADRVAGHADRRLLVDVAYKITALADTDTDNTNILEEARAMLDNAATSRGGQAKSLGELYPAIVDNIRSGKSRGLSTPWPDLDERIVGLQPGRLYVVAARPGVGKSMFAQGLATHMAAAHQRDVYFSTLEMQDIELGTRFLSSVTEINGKALQTGHLTADEWTRIERAGQVGFVDLKIHIDAAPNQTLENIRSGVRALSRTGQLGMIVVDYLQLMSGRQGKSEQNRAEVVAGFSRGLKNMAGEYGVPVVALSQLNRQAVGQAPTLSNLRESGAIEQDADVVILLDEKAAPDGTPLGILDVIVAKARNGVLGTFTLEKQGHQSTIS